MLEDANTNLLKCVRLHQKAADVKTRLLPALAGR